jgi:hypothetical protein
MTTVRTTFRPDLEVEVSPAEYLDLQRQGLLAEAPSSPASTVTEPVRAKTKED